MSKILKADRTLVVEKFNFIVWAFYESRTLQNGVIVWKEKFQILKSAD